MSEEQSFLRTTLLGSLLDAARRNRARGAEDVRLFESRRGLLARRAEGALDGAPRRDAAPARDDPGSTGCPTSATTSARCSPGRCAPPTWREPEPPRADFFAAKGVLAALLDTLRVPWRVEAGARAVPAPGPQRARARRRRTRPVGWLGELHPLGRRALGPRRRRRRLRGRPRRGARRGARAGPTSRTSTRSRRCARTSRSCVAGGGRAAEQVLEIVRAAGGALLRRAEVFDVYEGAQVGEGRRSLALRLEFRARRPHAHRRGGRRAARRRSSPRLASASAGRLRG